MGPSPYVPGLLLLRLEILVPFSSDESEPFVMESGYSENTAKPETETHTHLHTRPAQPSSLSLPSQEGKPPPSPTVPSPSTPQSPGLRLPAGVGDVDAGVLLGDRREAGGRRKCQS